MTPDERQLITGLFDRMRNVGSQSRDREAEQLIGDQVRSQPYAPYLLTQTVLVQDQALRAANDRIQQLEDDVRRGQGAGGQDQGGSFLGGLGRMFGGGQETRGGSVPTTGGQPPEPAPYRGQGYSQQQPGGPWGNQGMPPQQGGGLFGGGGGGGFMKGALGAAAGVAGGVLMADGIRSLFSGGHNDPFGMASGLGGGMGGLGNPGGETVINNYYDTPQDNQQDFGAQAAGDPGNYSGGNAGDYGSDDGGDPGSYT